MKFKKSCSNNKNKLWYIKETKISNINQAKIMKTKVPYITHLKKEPKRTHMLTTLVLLVTISLTLSIITVSDLQWQEHVSINRGVALFLLGLVFFTSLYNCLNLIILRTTSGQRLMKNYKLTVADIYDISNKEVSAVQALFCCLTGLTVCLYSCTRNVLKTSHYISEAYAWFGAAYFFYDIWSMYKVHQATVSIKSHNHMNGDAKIKVYALRKFINYLKTHPIIVGHHIFIGSFGFLVITYLRGGLGDCFFGFVYLMEASTPFVSLRGVLSKIGLKSSNIYVINGLVMLGTFFVCRVIMFPYVIFIYAKSVGLDYISAVHSLPTGCKISILILLLPQIYWFMLMVKGATQVLKPKFTFRMWRG